MTGRWKSFITQADAFVTCLDDVGEVTIDGVKYELKEGNSIVMPAGHPHAVYGKEQFKMLLVVISNNNYIFFIFNRCDSIVPVSEQHCHILRLQGGLIK